MLHIHRNLALYPYELTNPSATFSLGVGKDSEGTDRDYSSQVRDGQLTGTFKALTLYNLVSGEDVANLGTVSWDSVLDNKYYDSLNGDILTGTGASMSATNNSGDTADMMIIEMSNTGLYAKLTALGYSTDATKEGVMSSLVLESGYFEGLIKSGATEVKSVGKNLFDGEISDSDSNVETVAISDSSFSIKGLSSGGIGSLNIFPSLNFNENKQYTFSGKHFVDDDNNIMRLRIYYTNGTFDSFPIPTLTNTPFEITSDIDKTIDIISYTYASVGCTATYSDFMCELGSTATDYEPYTESTATLPEIGMMLPNGTQDEISLDGTKTQRVQEYVLQSENIDQLITNGVNVDMIQITIPSNWGNGGIGAKDIVITRYADTDSSWVHLDDINYINSWGWYYIVFNQLVLVVAKGTYATLAEAQADLAGTVIYYELATPIVSSSPMTFTTDGESSDFLKGYENGTIYQTPEDGIICETVLKPQIAVTVDKSKLKIRPTPTKQMYLR